MPGGPRLQLSIDGDVQLDRTLLRWADHVSDLSPLLNVLADRFLVVSAEQFDSEGRYSGGWRPLAPATVRRRGSAHPILNQTGALRRSLTVPGAPGAIRDVRAESMEVGSSDPKVGYHQHGTRRMPRRRPVDLAEAEREAWVKALQRYIVTGEARMPGAAGRGRSSGRGGAASGVTRRTVSRTRNLPRGMR